MLGLIVKIINTFLKSKLEDQLEENSRLSQPVAPIRKEAVSNECPKYDIPLKKPLVKKDQVFTFLNTEYQVTEIWIELFTHFILLDRHNKMPTKKWYKELETIINEIGNDEFLSRGSKWISDCIIKCKENRKRYSEVGAVAATETIQKNLGVTENTTPEWVRKVYGDSIIEGGYLATKDGVYLNNFQNYFYQSLGGRILRGFLHATILLKDERLIELVDKIAFADPNSSQDAIFIYSKLDKERSIPKLMRLKGKAKNRFILQRIDKAVTLIGKKHGLTKMQIEESVIPDYGINNDGEYKYLFGNVTCVLKLLNTKESQLYYELENGRTQKTAPKIIRENHASELKEFKRIVKEIKAGLTIQRRRIETFYLINYKIDFENFQINYLKNNLVRVLVKDLIWNFSNDDINVNLLLLDGKFIDANGNENDKDLANTSVSLWHPIGSDVDYIFSWRQMILERQVLQAFKQAFREVYILTDAEIGTENYSNRFAGHILDKDHVYALLKTRGWSPSGIVHNGSVSFKIPDSSLKVEFAVSDIDAGEYSKMYGSKHVTTDYILFKRDNERCDLQEITPIIFSETMRDVDLFVGVTSIGNDPGWYDRGGDFITNYYSKYTCDDLTARSKIRVEILKNIIPKMKISSVCEFDGKYLKVKGKWRQYKIHMGSSNILIEPHDQNLCIVPSRKNKKIKAFIPFEGDNLLSIIISKAILLANDDKIEDKSILSQINRK